VQPANRMSLGAGQTRWRSTVEPPRPQIEIAITVCGRCLASWAWLGVRYFCAGAPGGAVSFDAVRFLNFHVPFSRTNVSS